MWNAANQCLNSACDDIHLYLSLPNYPGEIRVNGIPNQRAGRTMNAAAVELHLVVGQGDDLHAMALKFFPCFIGKTSAVGKIIIQ